jgi:hypothetical protein
MPRGNVCFGYFLGGKSLVSVSRFDSNRLHKLHTPFYLINGNTL